MEEVKIVSNWDIDKENKLENLITLTTSENEECATEHVTPESCVLLTQGENYDADSKPELEIKSEKAIKGINVLSEGSLIEVFGVHDEYLLTCASELIDDWEGMAVYLARITLPGLSSCKLRFTRIKEKDRLWLYRIQLSITEQEKPSHLLFNLEHVNNLINSPSQEISEKAEKFRKLFELCVRNSSASQGQGIQNLFSVISREHSAGCSGQKQIVVECLNCSKLRKSKCKLSIDDIWKDYLDKRLREVREEVIQHVDEQLRELKKENDAKLDKIMASLLAGSKL